ncbi:uncharacterized protein LOC122756598 [Drosophila santomea]|uniref:uncharacterized protein LOC122756598 n=1 Tax=Drosophila santomea TaxID=129105 RepID=UPI001CCDF748|nr:uncharacterized protein LOC122756598 [Drosophila santomea]
MSLIGPFDQEKCGQPEEYTEVRTVRQSVSESSQRTTAHSETVKVRGTIPGTSERQVTVEEGIQEDPYKRRTSDHKDLAWSERFCRHLINILDLTMKDRNKIFVFPINNK